MDPKDKKNKKSKGKNSGKDFHRKPKPKDYMENPTYEDEGKPVGEKEVRNYLSTKALKMLPYSSYAIIADPYDASLPTSRPYPILNAFNRRIGGFYGGNRNIDGGNVQQYPNSLRSKLLAAFDVMKLNLSLQYRYRPIKNANGVPTDVGPDNDYIGSGLIDQCRQAIAEAVSVLQATTFTNMAIYNYVIETDMLMGSATREDFEFGSNSKSKSVKAVTHKYLYTSLTDVIYATTTYYQLFIQEVLRMINVHNAFRTKMGTMIRNSWNRETPVLNNLFGLFKKKSFLSLLDSLCLTMPGEYVDVEWAKQVNMIIAPMSRRSDSLLDPVLEIQGSHILPSVFRIYALDSSGDIIVDGSGNPVAIFDSTVDLTKTIVKAGKSVTITFQDAIDYISEHLSCYKVTAWARNHVGYQDADTSYFNEVKAMYDIVNLCMTSFKTKMNDVREVLDVVNRTGLNTWMKNFRPSVIKDTDVPLFNNNLVNDIFKTVFSGATEVTFNSDTKRFQTYAIWNMYDGIPEYDAYSGGSFLTFSGKQLDVESDVDKVYTFLPVMCIYDSSIVGSTDEGVRIQTVSRDGVEAYVKASEVVMGSDAVLSRLVPLDSQNSLKIRVPKFYAREGYVLDQPHGSLLFKALSSVFGLCQINSNNYVDPDIVAIYNIEIEDITNESIAYARATGPFKGSYGYEGTLGFATFGQNIKIQDK